MAGGFFGIFWEINKKVITLPYWKLLHRVSVPQGAELKGNQVRILNSTRCCKSQLIRSIGSHIATGCISLTKATSHYPGRREHDGDESEDLPTLQAYSCREASTPLFGAEQGSRGIWTVVQTLHNRMWWCGVAYFHHLLLFSALPLKCYRCAPSLADVAVASVFADLGEAGAPWMAMPRWSH